MKKFCLRLLMLILGLFFFNSHAQKGNSSYINVSFLSDSVTRNQLSIDLTVAYFESYFRERKATDKEYTGAQLLLNYRYDSIKFVSDTAQIIAFLNEENNGWSIGGSKVFLNYRLSLDSLLVRKNKSKIRLGDLYQPSEIKYQGERTAVWQNWVDKSMNSLRFSKIKNLLSIPTPETHKDPVTEVNSNWIHIVTWVVALVLFSLFLKFLVARIKPKKNVHTDQKDSLKRDKITELSHDLTMLKNDIKSLQKLESEIRKLKDEQDRFFNKLNSVERLLDQLKNNSNNKKTEFAEKAVPPQQAKTNSTSTKIIYLPPAFKDKTFNASEGNTNADRSTFYRLEQKSGEEKWTLFFHQNEDLIRSAFENPDSYIYYACEPTNALEYQKHTRIEMIKPGAAKKENGHWIIIKKICIKFS